MRAASRGRNFRLTAETIQTLTSEAKAQGLSVNALVAHVLARHLATAKYTKYNMVSVPGRTLSRLYEIMTDDQMDRAIDEISSNNPKDFLLRNKLPMSVEGLIEYFGEYSSQTGVGTCEVSHRNGTIYVTISIPHGPGLTKATGKIVSQAFMKIVGVDANVVTTENTVGFSVPESMTGKHERQAIQTARELAPPAT